MISKEKVARFYNKDVYQYNLKNTAGMQVSVLNYGGIITKILFYDKNGIKDNRILAYKDISLYKDNPMFFGAIIGRIAGRVSNGIYKLDGDLYKLEKNEKDRHLHGGTAGFHHCFWDVDIKEDNRKSILKLKLIDKEHDGFIGDLSVLVEYSLDDDNILEIHYFVETNKKTICNMTNHMYFNLLGSKSNDTIQDHYLKIDADEIAVVDEKTLPTWNFLNVDNEKVFNFKEFRKVGLYGMNTHQQQKLVSEGYDHAFKLNKKSVNDISLKENKTGIRVDVNTTEDAVIIYSCNKVDTLYDLESHKLKKYKGITIETQQLPDIVNTKEIDKIIITPGKPYNSRTTFRFSLEKG